MTHSVQTPTLASSSLAATMALRTAQCLEAIKLSWQEPTTTKLVRAVATSLTHQVQEGAKLEKNLQAGALNLLLITNRRLPCTTPEQMKVAALWHESWSDINAANSDASHQPAQALLEQTVCELGLQVYQEIAAQQRVSGSVLHYLSLRCGTGMGVL